MPSRPIARLPYLPRAGSLAARVVDHLNAHRDDALSSVDIARRFGHHRDTVRVGLRAAVAHGLLCYRGGRARCPSIYTAGPRLLSGRYPELPQRSTPAERVPPASWRGDRLRETDIYDGAELRPFAGRPGAMDAFALPSLINGRRVARGGQS